MNKTYFLLLLGVLCFTYCKNEQANAAEQIVGQWSLQEATRDGEPTSLLSELYFHFTSDGQMETNLPVAPGKATYLLEGKKIMQKGENGAVEYTIQSISDSVLILAIELKDTPFRFLLKRNNQ
ncbi:MAG TPA: hypothetical protein PKA00_12475 [Saprospiraceae bacterium]|nr:hypothetical protein [Saprospiraceae bacterium]HMQ83723.1 hypothetical protein [Saprospiraceae bacterium]